MLQGLQQVADNLQALAHDAELVDAQWRLLDSARTALALQRESYEAGKADLLQLIDAERSYQRARLGATQAQAQRLGYGAAVRRAGRRLVGRETLVF